MSTADSNTGPDPYLRLVSWNMGGAFAGGQKEWDYLLGDSTLDAGILQEAPYPSKVDLNIVPGRGSYWKTETGGFFRSRTAVVGLSDRVSVVEVPTAPLSYAGNSEMAVSRMGTVTAAEVVVTGTDERITVISVYGLWENPVPYERVIYADASMHRILSDISSLISGSSRPVVLAGDFNLVRGIEDPNDGELWNRRNASVFDRLDALGFTFVGPQTPNGVGPDTPTLGLPADSQAVVTHRLKRGDPATGRYQLDYVYVTGDLVDRVSTRALNDGEEWGPSDHCQVIIDFAEPTEPIWNEKTFATAVERHTGPTTRRTIEAIFDWAHQRGLRVAFAKGDWGQVWFQYDGGPEGFQYTFSVLADGKALVQFRYMKEPFSGKASRERIRRRLNEIVGVDLPDGRLKGRPPVPLAALADPDALAAFLDTFDHIVDETERAMPGGSTGPESPG